MRQFCIWVSVAIAAVCILLAVFENDSGGLTTILRTCAATVFPVVIYGCYLNFFKTKTAKNAKKAFLIATLINILIFVIACVTDVLYMLTMPSAGVAMVLVYVFLMPMFVTVIFVAWLVYFMLGKNKEKEEENNNIEIKK